MMMFMVYDDETKKRVLDELLKGERGVSEIALEEGMTNYTARKWLTEHYEANPDDPRRHLVIRESENYQRVEGEPAQLELVAGAEDDGADDDEEAREDMAKKKKKATAAVPYTKGKPHPQRDKILAEWDSTQTSDEPPSQAEIARKYGISGTTMNNWIRGREIARATLAKNAKLKAEVLADIEAGYTGDTLAKRHKGKVARSAVYRWQAEYRLKNPQSASAPQVEVEQTQLSVPPSVVQRPPAQSARSLVVRTPQPPMLPSDGVMADTLAECIGERTTLRGMVDLLTTENTELKRQLRAYQRTYGEIRQ